MRLQRIERRERIFDNAMGGCFCLLLMAIFFAVFQLDKEASGTMARMFDAGVSALFAGYPLIHLLQAIDRYVRRRWITSYYIEECDGVLKVCGGVKLDDFGYVESRLLAMRHGYMIAKNAYERYGCTIAAVPVSESYRKAQQELAEYGFAVR